MTKNPQRVLLLGCSGWVGNRILHAFRHIHPLVRITGTYCAHRIDDTIQLIHFDYTQPQHLQQLTRFIEQFRPHSIINALHGVNDALDTCNQQLIKLANAVQAQYVFISSSVVFDADLTAPHHEDDPIGGSSDYGVLKQRSEEEIVKHANRFLIVRFSALHGYAPYRVSRTERFLQRLANNENVVVDRGVFQNRLEINDAAAMITHLITRGAEGIYHLGTTDQNEEIDFLRAVAMAFGYPGTRIVPGASVQKYLTVVPGRVFTVLGHQWCRTEQDTIRRLHTIPEFEKYKHWPSPT